MPRPNACVIGNEGGDADEHAASTDANPKVTKRGASPMVLDLTLIEMRHRRPKTQPVNRGNSTKRWRLLGYAEMLAGLQSAALKAVGVADPVDEFLQIEV